MEHVAGGQNRLAILVEIPRCAFEIAVATDDLLCLGIPDNQLFIAVLTDIELIDVHRLACSSPRLAESNLAQTTDLLHDIGCIVSRYDIDLVMTLVGHAKLVFCSQFTLQNFLGNGLDNLWDGLGALTVIKPNVKYFFGKMTMYPSYIRKGRDMILYFLHKHFADKENLIVPMKPLEIEADPKELEQLFCEKEFKKDYLILNTEIRKLGYNIPPLVNAYMSLSPTMKLFGTAINYGFGDVEETGILIAIEEIFEQKRVRHIDSFIKEHPEALKITSGANKVIYKEQKD